MKNNSLHEVTNAFQKFLGAMVVILLAAFVFLFMYSYNISKRANELSKQNKDYIRFLCENSNERNATHHNLWNFILNSSPVEKPSPEVQKEIDKRVKEFKDLIDKSFSQKECPQ